MPLLRPDSRVGGEVGRGVAEGRGVGVFGGLVADGIGRGVLVAGRGVLVAGRGVLVGSRRGVALGTGTSVLVGAGTSGAAVDVGGVVADG